VKVGTRVGVVVGIAVGGVTVEIELGGDDVTGAPGDRPARLQACTVNPSTNTAMSSFFMEKTIPGRLSGVKEGTAMRD